MVILLVLQSNAMSFIKSSRNRKVSFKFLVIVILFPLLFGCGGGKFGPSDDGAVAIDVDVSTNISIENFVASERYVVLETNDSSLIDNLQPGYLAITDDKIFVRSDKEILSFSNKGEYLACCNRYGQGPEEYIDIQSFKVFNDEIYILSQSPQCIHIYTPDGNFKRIIKLPYNYLDFEILSSDKILLASGNFNPSFYNFSVFDVNTGKLTENYLPYGIYHTCATYDYVAFAGKIGDDVIVNQPFCLNNYKIGENGAECMTEYHFNTQEQLPTFDPMTLNVCDMIDLTSNAPFVRQLGYYCKTKGANYLTFRLFSPDTNGFRHRIVKYSDDGVRLEQAIVGLDISEKYPYFRDIYQIVKDEVVCPVSAFSLLYIDKKIESDFWLSNGLTEESNPVIFFFKLK